MRGLLHDFFKSLGYKVECFSTGGAALKRLHESTHAVSAVVADIRMTPMNGMHLLNLVKRDHPEIPVVLFTAAGSPDQRDEALRQGALQYLMKPFSLADLQKAIADKSRK